MSKKRSDSEKGGFGIEGIFKGLAEVIERLGDLAEKGEELSRSGEIPLSGKDKDLKGIFGFSVKMGLGGEGVKVEPFGNVSKKDSSTGRTVVDEIREPLVDVFEEKDHVLIVAEMPGIQAGDVQTDLQDDILVFTAQRGDKKYRKEVLLPGDFQKSGVTVSCTNGIVEIKCMRQ